MSVFKNTSEPPKVILDSYADLLEKAYDRLEALTDGEFVDRSKSSPVYPFIATQAFVGSELLYAANKAGELLVYRLINNLTGIERGTGTPAKGVIRFSLNASRLSDYVIPQNTQVSSKSLNLRYYTSEQLVIPAGQLYGDVEAEAERFGEEYNVDTSLVNSISIPLAGLSTVRNITPMVGGSSPESEEEFGTRLRRSLRPRTLVSIRDYAEFFNEQLGGESRIRVIPFLSADRLNQDERGSIHAFVLGPEGNTLSNAQINRLRAAAIDIVPVATRLYISNAEPFYVDVDCHVRIDDDAPVDQVVDALYEAVNIQIGWQSVDIGASVINQRVLSELAKVDGVTWIEAVNLNSSFGSLAMPNPWNFPRVDSLHLVVTNSTGLVFEEFLYYQEGANDAGD